MGNDLINELYNKLDAQDKIINNQALEIARLKEELKNKPDMKWTVTTTDGQELTIIQSERIDMQVELNKSLEEMKKRIDKAIEYINKRMIPEGEYWLRKAKHFKNTEYGKDLLEILEDNE